jgi:hypothetical protein
MAALERRFFKKSLRIPASLSATDASVQIGLGVGMARLLGMKVWNQSAAGSKVAGTSTTQKIKVVDADSRVVYLDASDRDYATAAVWLNIVADDTTTGLTGTHVDSTGAARAAGEPSPLLPFRSPVVVHALNAGTSTDVISVSLILER